ncbi:hypothetical protein LZ32DRAFT_545044 [Colletotrichum eremochloae]|uniref:Uncharacterized protein n=1 Tax=Colletotrichum sublineola TaxID=1173701 RepID=A0A066XD89_COLSU|nr:hypothetical protein LY78DRAFT_698056 [Colletotrichum sublineola]KAK2005943.1 hypothetical protein LZ32DRAFT_545044 [Colletotrichum eremochloae]KDN64000.1 hypothetical protein CSUB01_12628 [Colletotrichum sublineola]
MIGLFHYLILALSLIAVHAGLLEEHGYTVEEYTNGLYYVKSGHYLGGSAPLNKVRINTSSKTMTIYLAYNGQENYHTNKLRLSQILGALCAKESIDPDDLDWVIIDDVENLETKAAMKEYRQKHRLTFRDEIRITPNEAEDWAMFSDTPFYKAVYYMLPRKGIDKIIVKNDGGNQDMYLSIG